MYGCVSGNFIELGSEGHHILTICPYESLQLADLTFGSRGKPSG